MSLLPSFVEGGKTNMVYPRFDYWNETGRRLYISSRVYFRRLQGVYFRPSVEGIWE